MNMNMTILAIYISFYTFAATANSIALETTQKVIRQAQKVWSLKKAISGESILETKKGAFCALGEDFIHLTFISQVLFGRTYTKANEKTQIEVQNALLNNFSHIFLNEIADKINYHFDWEKAQIQTGSFGRGDIRTSGFSIKVATWPKGQPPSLASGSSPSYVIFDLIENTQDSHVKTYKVIDLVLAGLRVSELYKPWVNNIRMGRNTLEEVLEVWSTENQPLCPAKTQPYRKLYL